MGCYIRGIFAGAYMYADDLLLVSISLTELQKMVTLCKTVLDGIDMIINTNKTMCMRVGPKFNASCVNITLNQQSLQWAGVIRYLGIFIESYKVFKISLDDARKRFYIASNSILSKICKDQIAVVLSLIASYCTPVLLYGLETITFNKSERTRLNNPFNMVFNKLFGSYNKSVIASCQYYCGYLPFSLLLDLKTLRFMRKLSDMQNINSFVYFLYNLSGRDEFQVLAAKYNVNITDSDASVKRKIWNSFSVTFSNCM
jgi:hypothetical protein